KMLSESPTAAPPEDLLENLKAEIPEEMPETPGVLTGSPAGAPAWMKAAAALLLTAAAGLIGYRVVRESAEKRPPVPAPAATPATKVVGLPVEPPRKDVHPSRPTAPVRTGAGPATIEVRARDESGAALPGVSVRVRGDGVDRRAVTDPMGRVEVDVPKGGTYRVESELAGFEKKVEVAQAASGKRNEVDAKMKVAATAEAVTVTGEVPILDRSAAVAGAQYSVAAPPPLAGAVPPPPRAMTASAQAPTVQPPSTGGTREPNDAPYGDVFFKEYGTNPFVDTDDDRLSTFGLDVDTGSYTVARRYLNDGNLPPREAIRVEEFINAFSYGDAPPSRGDFAVRAEAAPTPFMKGDLYRVVRFNVRGRVVDEKDRKPAVVTFVVDVSGSMNLENRLELVKKALGLLLDSLKPSDRVGLVVYGSEARRLLDPTSDREALRDAISRLSPAGSTNAEDGLRTGYEMAAQFRRRDAINRVILCSDGVANVGRTGPESILRVIEREAKENEIELTTVGFGMGNYNDVLMEQLANRGDGRYAYVDTLEEARRIFVEELTGTLQTIASDAKVQVEFEPSVVSRWRLIGYENRDIADEKFRDDTVDAGEIGAGHSVTALYEIKLKEDAPRGRTAATLHLRWRSKETGRVVETERELRLSEFAGSWDSAPRRVKLASLVAEFGEILKGNYWAKDGDLREVLRRARGLAMDERTAELVGLVERAERLKTRNAE
ncbi:MAG TPA: von Willebrand factor type A domain-containing protein, partial [Thermoanaerobaculia bacterium]|nr:von Willebrand factor type A domain-containing protein [Thermoanaerobaculia bacterium]